MHNCQLSSTVSHYPIPMQSLMLSRACLCNAGISEIQMIRYVFYFLDCIELVCNARARTGCSRAPDLCNCVYMQLGSWIQIYSTGSLLCGLVGYAMISLIIFRNAFLQLTTAFFFSLLVEPFSHIASVGLEFFALCYY